MRFYQIICVLIFSLASSAAVQAKALTVMISGGFMAAWETLAPQFEAQQGYKIHTISGPSMGKTPQAIPSRLAHGDASRQLLAYLASPGVQQVVQATGLHSVTDQHANKESDIAQ